MPPAMTSEDKKSGRHCCLAHHGDADYTRFSTFMARIFQKGYGAHVMVSYPTLIAICGNDKEPLAALGLRGAAESPLFLEHYLSKPAEQAVAERTGLQFSRSEIAEAGNLASTQISALKDLMFALSLNLKQQGYRYILFTGTDSLKRYLEALGLFPTVYAPADPERLGEDAKQWGRYYQMHPQVMGGPTDEFYYGLLAAYGRKDELA